MKTSNISWICFSIIMVFAMRLQAQTEQTNEFTIDAKLVSRAELRVGGFNPDTLDENRYSNFALGQYRITATYKRSWLEMRLSPQSAGVWGESPITLSFYEAWAKMHSKKGFFVQLGRQALSYDDERILGNDDWTMTAPTHDVLKLGFENDIHKVHLILEYNQTSDNVDNGNTYYTGGLQPHKSMQTLWYHFDTPNKLFGISLLGMNIGMQSRNEDTPTETYYQQLVGTYMRFQPKRWSIEGAFYYQMGKEEHGIPMDAFMGSIKANYQLNDKYSFYAGYDYLSGDKYFNIPPTNAFGLILHDKMRGFNPVFGSHHEFYGAMDFFYVSNFVGSFTPGLQNLYIGGNLYPINGLNINAAYHYFAVATNPENFVGLGGALVTDWTLGHEIEVSASYDFSNAVQVSAGYSYMRGSETMYIIDKIDENRRLHWAWLMLTISPRMFGTTWQDKVKTME